MKTVTTTETKKTGKEKNQDALAILKPHLEKLEYLVKELDGANLGGLRIDQVMEFEQLSIKVSKIYKACKAEYDLRVQRQHAYGELILGLPKLNDAITRVTVHKSLKSLREVNKELYISGKVADPDANYAALFKRAHEMLFEIAIAAGVPALEFSLTGSKETNDRQAQELDRRRCQRRIWADVLTEFDVTKTADVKQVLKAIQFGIYSSKRKSFSICRARQAVGSVLGRKDIPTFKEALASVAKSKLSDAEKVVQAALLMRGCFYWKAKSINESGISVKIGRDNGFRRWLNLAAKEPDEYSSMNCWEAIYFAAYKAGVMEKGALEQLYKKESSAALLGYDKAKEFDLGKDRPQRGQVLFSDTDVDPCKHVVLCLGPNSLGNIEVMSLWSGGTGFTFDIAPITILEGGETDKLVATKWAAPFGKC
jgi:hypothetical protein